MNVPAQTLIHYLRDKKGNPRGVLVAVKLPDGEVSVHYSYCRKNDRFTKDMALQIAIGRAMTNTNNFGSVPQQVLRELQKFNDRIMRYYKVNKDRIHTW
jgi:hypothetical protein